MRVSDDTALASIEQHEQVIDARVGVKTLAVNAANVHRGGMYKDRFKSPEEIATVMVWADEHNVPRTTALGSLYVVQGRLACEGQMMLALIHRSEQVKVTWPNYSPDRITCRMERCNGLSAFEETLTSDEAKCLPNYEKHKGHLQAWMRWRLVSSVGRVVCPDIIGGLYTPAEIEEDTPAAWAPSVTVTQEPKSVQRFGALAVQAMWDNLRKCAALLDLDPDVVCSAVQDEIDRYRETRHLPDKLAEWPVTDANHIATFAARLVDGEAVERTIYAESASEDGGE